MGKAVKRGPASPQMNMTPMIDVTFQLIIFFMLVNNIIAEESVTLMVPKLWEPKTKELGDVKRITVNIVVKITDSSGKEIDARSRYTMNDPLGLMVQPVSVKVGLVEHPWGNWEELTEDLVSAREANKDIEILLRADGASQYEHVQPVMAAITAAKIKTVNLVAFLPDGGPNNLNAK